MVQWEYSEGPGSVAGHKTEFVQYSPTVQFLVHFIRWQAPSLWKVAPAICGPAGGTRKRIAALRKEAVDLETTGPVVPPLSEWTALCETLDSAAVEVSSLKARLAQAEEALEVARAAAIEYKRRQEAGNENARQMSQKLQQASDLELSLDSTIIASPSPEDFRAADDDVVAATDLVTNAEAWQAELDARAECERLTTGALVAIGRAEALNAIVENLTTAAPAELAARSVTIKGLTFTEDGGIALDGVVLDLISGNEGINFCVQVAKRAHPKCKILTVNGLEALDPEELEAFVRFATADGWQLIGTKVQGGELVIELLEAT